MRWGHAVLRLYSRKQTAWHAVYGITNDLRRRIEEHRSGMGSKFVKQYRVLRLVCVETCDDPEAAIRREKQLKKWKRDWKIRLIEGENLEWRDLSHLIG